MPRISKRLKLLEELQHAFRKIIIEKTVPVFDSNKDSMEDALDEAIGVSLLNARRKRYLFRYSQYRKGQSQDRFILDLDNNEAQAMHDQIDVHQGIQTETYDNQQPWLSDDEFIPKNWMSKKNLALYSKGLREILSLMLDIRNKHLLLSNSWCFSNMWELKAREHPTATNVLLLQSDMGLLPSTVLHCYSCHRTLNSFLQSSTNLRVSSWRCWDHWSLLFHHPPNFIFFHSLLDLPLHLIAPLLP